MCIRDRYVPSADSAANYMVSPTMTKEGEESYNTSEYGTWCLGIPANSPHPELCLLYTSRCV